ncbi:D-alanyl-D-alanine carboxypeptidase family protein [Blastochloris sulfoviridis]|uniref:D-alanyl-D-alanine carboxypeptidase family protein n=1 Tax=Blastochloris sulfoviridis TaxID=50712 RepID=UPI001478311C|nr:D-alanyl-D-alanine carboxypeptidase family protein [Blastochloris sulfoviridis]
MLLAAAPAGAAPALLVEADSGQVLQQREAGRPWYPASVTKLMTTYVALARIRDGRAWPETIVTFSDNAVAQSPSKMGFKAGTQITLENALRMLMVKSANDVAVAVAETLGGSVAGFAADMNAYAQRLGMSGSNFVNPHGLPDAEQYTTARDMAVLTRALIHEFPQAEALFRIPAIQLGKIKMRNHNALLHRYDGTDGMKTGFICASGFNVVVTATRGGKRLIAVVFGGATANERNETAAALLEKGFQPRFSLFESSSSVESISNTGGGPANISDVVCGKGRKQAEDTDDEPAGAAVPRTTSDPDDIYATIRGDRSAAASANAAGAGAAKPGKVARPSLLGPVVIRPAVPVYVGPARGDTLLAGIASTPATLAAAPRRLNPDGRAVAASVAAGGAPLPLTKPITPAIPNLSAYAPGGGTASVPVPRPRPRSN